MSGEKHLFPLLLSFHLCLSHTFSVCLLLVEEKENIYSFFIGFSFLGFFGSSGGLVLSVIAWVGCWLEQGE